MYIQVSYMIVLNYDNDPHPSLKKAVPDVHIFCPQNYLCLPLLIKLFWIRWKFSSVRFEDIEISPDGQLKVWDRF